MLQYPYLKILYISHFPYILWFFLKDQHSGMKKAVLKLESFMINSPIFIGSILEDLKLVQTREYVQTYNLSYAKKSYFTPHSFWVKFVGKAKFE